MRGRRPVRMYLLPERPANPFSTTQYPKWTCTTYSLPVSRRTCVQQNGFHAPKTQSGHERAAFAAMHATGLLLFIDTGCKRPHELAMDSSHHARRIRARARRLSAGAWDMRMH